MWAAMIKENVSYVHERELIKKWNWLVFKIGSFVLLLILLLRR